MHCLGFKFVLAISFGQFSFVVFSFVLLGTWRPPNHISSCLFLTRYNFPIFFLFSGTNAPKNASQTNQITHSQFQIHFNGLKQFLSLEGLFLYGFLTQSWNSWISIPYWFVGVRLQFLSCQFLAVCTSIGLGVALRPCWLVALSRRNIVLVSRKTLLF